MVPDRLRMLGYGMLLLTLVVATTLGGTLVAAQGVDDAPDYTEEANHTVRLPAASDHYPGDQNPENASQDLWFAGKDGLREEGAEDGIWVDYFVVDAAWIDYSACDETNVDAFGIDRGNNDSGRNPNDSPETALTSHQDGRFLAEFYNWEDIAGDPPYLAPEDAIEVFIGSGSPAGGCLTMTSEPGWYQTQGFVNGTEADNGPEQQPSENASDAAIKAHSNYVYVCDCENESEARERLGPPPDEATTRPTPTEGNSTPTVVDATPTDGDTTPTATTPTATSGDTPTPTPTLEQNDTDSTETPTEGTQTDPGVGVRTTAGDGPGFDAGIAVAGVLAAALLARSRRP